MSGAVEDKDFGWKEVLSNLAKSDGKTTKVGIVGEAAKQQVGERTVKVKKTRRKKRKGLAGVILGDKVSEVVKTRPFTLAEVATVHEYGAPEVHIPERSFMRSAVDDNRDAIVDEFIKVGEDIFDPTKEVLKNTLEHMGQMVAGFMKQKIVSGLEPPLSAQQAEVRSGDDRPLAVWLSEGTTLEHEERGGGKPPGEEERG